MKRTTLLFVSLLLLVGLTPLLAACGQYKDNPVGFNFVFTQTPVSQSPIAVPASSVQTVAHLRDPGLGTTPASWAAKYGKPLPISQPPTMYVFKAGLEDFPNGSIVVVSFDKGAIDGTARAVQISWIAGNGHPTTYNQAQAIAEGYFPDDAGLPTVLQKQDPGQYKCLVKGYQSATLATVFPKELFQGADGNLVKAGSIAVNLFPLYPRPANSYNDGSEAVDNSNNPSDTTVSSVLITMGTRPYC